MGIAQGSGVNGGRSSPSLRRESAELKKTIMKSTGLFVLLAVSSLQAQIHSLNTNLTSREQSIVAAVRPEAAPRFNGARLIGIHPQTPFLHSLAVSGARPITFAVDHLPAGLKLDPKSGIITGSLAAGDYT